MDKKEIMWSIYIKSSANTMGLSKEDVEDAIFSIKSDHSRTNKKNFYDKTREEYKGTIAVWQMDKSEEVERNFINGLSVKFDEDVVTVETKFEMAFPDDWDRGDVSYWVDGFNRLTLEYLELSMERMVALYKADEKFDDIKNKKIINVLREIERNQNWNIQNIS